MINGLFWLSKHFWQRHLNFQFEKINFFCLFIFFLFTAFSRLDEGNGTTNIQNGRAVQRLGTQTGRP